MLSVTMGPATFRSNTVNPAYRVGIEQKLPFPGKLRLRGEAAQAEAMLLVWTWTTCSQLIQGAQDAFYEYYFVTRSLEVSSENLLLLKKFRENAKSRYQNNLVSQVMTFSRPKSKLVVKMSGDLAL